MFLSLRRMDKSAGRGNVRGKGRGREKQSQQQPQSGQQSSAPNVWNQRAQQQQPQAPAQQQQPQAPAQQPQPHLVQSQASNPWNKGSASASAATAATAVCIELVICPSSLITCFCGVL